MEKFRKKMEEGNKKAVDLSTKMEAILGNKVSIVESGYSFRVRLPGNYKLSFSFAMDMRPTDVETALILNDNLYYNENLGYEDVRRHNNTLENAMSEYDRLLYLIEDEGIYSD